MYFLETENDIAKRGRDFDSDPGGFWRPGTPANYLQQWNRAAWVDTPEAQKFRNDQAAELGKPNPIDVLAQTTAAILNRRDVNSIRQRAESIKAFRDTKQLTDAFNTLQAWAASLKAAVAAATNLADLKARIAATTVPAALPVPTRADHRAAVVAIINADDPNG